MESESAGVGDVWVESESEKYNKLESESELQKFSKLESESESALTKTDSATLVISYAYFFNFLIAKTICALNIVLH